MLAIACYDVCRACIDSALQDFIVVGIPHYDMELIWIFTKRR